MGEVTIRRVETSDVRRLLEIYSYYVENTAITFEYKVPTEKEFTGRIAAILKKYPYIVIEQDGKVMGYAYAGTFKGRAAYDWSCELSIYVDKDARGLGYGGMLYEALEHILANMKMQNLYACVTYADEEDEYLTRASVHFHEHMGYEICGKFSKCGYKFGRWYSMVWMEKIIGEHEKNCFPVKNFLDL